MECATEIKGDYGNRLSIVDIFIWYIPTLNLSLSPKIWRINEGCNDLYIFLYCMVYNKKVEKKKQ